VKIIARVLLYGTAVAVIALLVLRTTNRTPDLYSGPVRIGRSQQETAPVSLALRPPSTHPPFVAPTPFVRPYENAALSKIEPLSAAGDAEARCELGIRYVKGIGIAKDESKARVLFQQAADKKNACGINRLGNLAHDQGDDSTALPYYRAAAAMGYPPSYYNLASVAKWGVLPDEVEAFKWFKTAALHGFVPAYDFYGTGILQNRDGPVDPWIAEQWYRLGAQAGDSYAMYDLGWYYIYRSDEPDRYRKAIAWLKKSTCECPGFYEIGRLYAKGLGVPRDLLEAARWYKRSADLGYAPAQVAYGNLVRSGVAGAPPNAAGALAYYTRAAEQGNGDAMYAIAQMTELGIAVPRDPAKAETMYVAAAAHCSGPALFRLAQLRAAGTPTLPKDAEEAMALASVSLSCGADNTRVEPFLKTLASHLRDPAKADRDYQRYRAAIYDYTGDPNFAPQNPLPPDVGTRQPTI
jgi:TPR repeat protein